MRRYLTCGLILMLAVSLVSCSRQPKLSPKETVSLYLDELEIIKDPRYYKTFQAEEKDRDQEKVNRYAKALKTTDELVYTQSSNETARKNTLMLAPLMLMQYSNYKVEDVKADGDSAFVDVTFDSKDMPTEGLGKIGNLIKRPKDKPVVFELLKTEKGWRIKDIDSTLD